MITANDITKLKIEPTDVVVCNVPEPMARKEAHILSDSLRRVCEQSLDRVPGIIILPAGFDVKTMERAELEEMKKSINRLLKTIDDNTKHKT